MAARHVTVPLALLLLAAACGSGDDDGDDDGANPSLADTAPIDVAIDDGASPTAAPATNAPPTEPATTNAPVTDPPGASPSATDPPTQVTTTEPVAPAYDFSAISPVVGNFVDREGLNGAGLVVVHRDHGVVHEEYWGEFSPERISLIASSSKMITAGVLLRLQDDGLLDIDAPIADVVDWGAGNPDVTPAQLVSNSSGLVGLLPDPGYGPYVCQFLPVGTLQDCAAGIFQTADDDADVIAPDTAFRYGGAQWQVAGAVAEAASGKSWAQLIEEIYVEPCGLESLAFNNHFTQIGAAGFDYPTEFDSDPSQLAATDNPNMEGGAYIDAGDYGTLLLMHLRGGMCGDDRVLSEAAVARMHEDRIEAAYGGDAGVGTGYGMGWWVDRASGRISDPGAYGSVPWLDLEDGYGVYLVVEADTARGGALAGELYDLIDVAIVGG